MKKIVLMIVAMMSMTMTYAENENNNATLNADAYNMNINMRKLAVTLGLNGDQMEAVEDIHNNFCNEMKLAAAANSDEREALVDNAIRKDIRYMHYVLDRKQYRTYLMLLNVTLQTRGVK